MILQLAQKLDCFEKTAIPPAVMTRKVRTTATAITTVTVRAIFILGSFS